jgi:hypothetical protein
VVDRAGLPAAVRANAAQIAAQSPRAVLAIKTLVDEAAGARQAVAGALPSVAPRVEKMYTSRPVRIALAQFEERRAARSRAGAAVERAETDREQERR